MDQLLRLDLAFKEFQACQRIWQNGYYTVQMYLPGCRRGHYPSLGLCRCACEETTEDLLLRIDYRQGTKLVLLLNHGLPRNHALDGKRKTAPQGERNLCF